MPNELVGRASESSLASNISPVFPDRTSDGHHEERSRIGASEEHRRVQDLVEKARSGDRDAFGEIYRTYRGSIYRLASVSLGAGAEDVVAETFLRAWQGLPRYRDRGVPFAAWLYSIARHVVVDQLRIRGRVQPHDTVPDEPVRDEPDQRLDLAAAIAALPDKQRMVIEMKYLLGLTNPEVAKALRTTTGAVNAKQWRALQSLQKILEAE